MSSKSKHVWNETAWRLGGGEHLFFSMANQISVQILEMVISEKSVEKQVELYVHLLFCVTLG